MYVPSNVSIMSIKRSKTYSLIIGIFLWCTAGQMSAQEFYLDSIRPTTIHTIQAQLDAYVSGFYHLGAAMQTATMTYQNKNDYALEDVVLNAGVSTSIYSTNFPFMRFVGSVGYKYLRYNYEGDFFSNAGIHTHWFTSEWKLAIGSSWIGIEAGLGVDALMHHAIVESNHFNYVGLNGECLNKVTVAGLAGVYLPLQYCHLEFIVNLYIIPPFNAQKIAYYNLSPTEVDFWSYEFRIYVPIFTTFSNNSALFKHQMK